MCRKRNNDDKRVPRAGTISIGSTGETWGYDNADEFVKAINEMVSDYPDDVKWHVNLKRPEILKAAIDYDMSARGYETPFGYDDIVDAEPGIKGAITDLRTAEIFEFTDSDKYVEAVQERTFYSVEDFRFETFTDNSAVWAKLDMIADSAFGMYDENWLEHALARPIVKGSMTFGEYIEKRMPVDSEKVFHGQRKGYLVHDARNGSPGRRKNEGFGQKNRHSNPANSSPRITSKTVANTGRCNSRRNPDKSRKLFRGNLSEDCFEKTSVLARLAENQKIVKEREEAKKRGEIYLQDIPGRNSLPFPDAAISKRPAPSAKVR